ncbi:MAG: exodeoxyribonuclease VII large subunit [Pseudomonadota bacterium]
MDLLDDPDEAGNAPEFSVSELSGAVKRVVEGEFSFVRVRGEVGRVSRPWSGHIYLDLKDDKAVLAGVIWKGVATRLVTQPEEGLEVVATGRLTTFPGQSKYQIVIEDIRPAGAGALMAMLEKRKKALEAEGLFAPERKRPLPFLPEVIGVVTSPSGAVIRDILHRLRDRFPRKVLVWPVAVQGDKCAPEVTRAIQGFNAFTPGGALPRPDVLIVARGGGSIEDLWGFNEEVVVRAAAASEIPLISAVGHETDTTLIDHAADRRAPTPTAAAEIAVPVRVDLLAHIDGQGTRLRTRLSEALQTRGQRLRDLGRGLPRPEALLEAPRQRVDIAGTALTTGLRSAAQRKRTGFVEAAGRLVPSLLVTRLRTRGEALGLRAERLAPALRRGLGEHRRRLDAAVAGLGRVAAAEQRRAAERRERLDAAWARLGSAERRNRQAHAEALQAVDRLRLSLGYEETLARGYALVWAQDKLVTSAKEAEVAGGLEIQFQDGRFGIGSGARKKGPKGSSGGDQGSLF